MFGTDGVDTSDYRTQVEEKKQTGDWLILGKSFCLPSTYARNPHCTPSVLMKRPEVLDQERAKEDSLCCPSFSISRNRDSYMMASFFLSTDHDAPHDRQRAT